MNYGTSCQKLVQEGPSRSSQDATFWSWLLFHHLLYLTKRRSAKWARASSSRHHFCSSNPTRLCLHSHIRNWIISEAAMMKVIRFYWKSIMSHFTSLLVQMTGINSLTPVTPPLSCGLPAVLICCGPYGASQSLHLIKHRTRLGQNLHLLSRRKNKK